MAAIRRRGGPATAALVAAVAILAGTIGGAFALSFTDTGGYAFEAEIDAITDAGCASGFSDGSFQPREVTKRGQFAYWLNNCGGRIAYASQTNTLTGGSGTVVVLTDSITTGGATGSGQTQFLHLHGTATVGPNGSSYATFCGNLVLCQIKVQLFNGNTKLAEQILEIQGAEATMEQIKTPVAVQAVVSVPTGSVTNYSLRVEGVNINASQMKIHNRQLTATMIPFGATGGNTL
jgi:hypothetical protein